LVRRRVEAVALEVAARRLHRRPGEVDRRDARRRAERRRDREAAGVGEDVQHAPSARERADPVAILALVEEEAGLLAGEHVDEVVAGGVGDLLPSPRTPPT